MENLPSNEVNATPEKMVTELPPSAIAQKLQIQTLFERDDMESVAAMTMVHEWLNKLEPWAEEDPTNRRRALLDVARSDFYLAMKDPEGGIECLEGALMIAQQQGHVDLMESIEKRITLVLKFERNE